MVTHEYQTLLTCPLHVPVVVTRVVDQDSEFLKFLEDNNLKPGQTIRVEARDAAADQVIFRGKNERELTIGTLAAAKLQVRPAASPRAHLS